MQNTLFLSNRLENLLAGLQERLFSSDDFHQKSVVVASRGMKKWVKGKILASRGSFFGIHLVTLGEFLQDGYPGFEELAVPIFGHLGKIDEIKTYLIGTNEGKQEEKEVALALHLASLFSNYHQLDFSPPKGDWQSKLFEKVKQPSPLTFPNGSLFFFGFSHLPKHFFVEIQQKQIPCYFLTPTLHFWEDLRKEEYPILGLLGKMGRVMARTLSENGEGGETRLFSLPGPIVDHPDYSTSITGEELVENGAMTLLTALQADLLLMREGDKIDLPKDSTIEIHVAASKEREVLILKDRLLLLMAKEGLTPGEILVMAKDISPYLPLLKTHFDRESLPFKTTYQEADIGTSSASWALLKSLLTLDERRFRASEILSFFSSSAVRMRLYLDAEEIEGLQTIIQEGAIFWGWDLEDREKSILLEPRSSLFPTGSWTEGFKRLLNRLLGFEGEIIPLKDPLPLSFAETLARWVERLEKLRTKLLGKKRQSLKAWSLWTAELIAIYLGKEGEIFEDLLAAFKIEDETPIPFSMFFSFLERGVKGIEATPGPSDWDAILFTSLGPMRAVPKRVIWLLGMEEENFPSKDSPLFGDLSLNHSEKISKRDQDRYAFLETILSTRERLIISYSTPLLVPPSEGEVSPVVQELISTLDEHFLIEGAPFSTSGIFIHPRSRFDESLFLEEAPFPSTSKGDFDLLFPRAKVALPPKVLPSLQQEVKIKELLIFARDPAQTFFRAHFETSLPWFDSKLPLEEPFAFSKQLKRDLDRSKLPPSLKVSFEGKAFSQATTYLSEREKLIASKKPFRVFFERDCQTPLQDEKGNWILPPLQIDDLTLIGPLGLLSLDGLLVEGDEKENHPLLLISQLLPFKVAPKLHLLDEDKIVSIAIENPEDLLRDFLRLYREARQEKPLLAQEKTTRYGELLV